MARPTPEAIQAFMSITGASETLALQRLEVYARFSNSLIEFLLLLKNDQKHGGNLSQAVNAHFGELERNIVKSTSGASTHYDFVDDSYRSQTRQRGLSSFFSAARAFRPSLLLNPNYRRKLLNQIGGSAFSGRPPPVSQTGEVTGFPVGSTWGSDRLHPSGLGHALDGDSRSSPSHGPEIHGNTERDQGPYLFDNGIEEEMIRAAIEASKNDEQECRLNKRDKSASDLSEVLSSKEIRQKEDEELAQALSLSLKTQELEKAMREQIAETEHHQPGVYDSHERSEITDRSRSKPGSSSVQCRPEDVKQKRPTNYLSGQESHSQHIEESPYRKEWGGISSKELDEAIMLETAIFSEIRDNASRNRQRESDLEEQSSKCIVKGEAFERRSNMKESLLPAEPAVGNEDAITLLVRMPDGSRRGRRFLKSDKLQFVFDFIDIVGAVKPGSYRVVQPYPRRAFSVDEGAFSFKELGLTSKQEALFLELI